MATASDWLTIDMTEVEELAARMNAAADQIPFALANAMNHAAFVTRQFMIDNTWPQHVEVRNPNFIRAALRVEQATKQNLTVTIFDALNKSVKLKLHAEGGTKSARGRFAIPNPKYVRKDATGVPVSQKPRNLPDSFIRGNVIYQRVARGLQMMYVLARSIVEPKDVPFYADFQTHMADEIMKAFPDSMERAMKTRRPK